MKCRPRSLTVFSSLARLASARALRLHPASDAGPGLFAQGRLSAMKRTTIMLPEDLRRRAMAGARRKGISLGELIRHSLETSLPEGTYDSRPDPLFESVVYDGPAPRDVSRDHDRYLYDDEK